VLEGFKEEVRELGEASEGTIKELDKIKKTSREIRYTILLINNNDIDVVPIEYFVRYFLIL